MAFQGTIYFCGGDNGDWIGQLNTITGDITFVTTRAPGMPSDFEGAWGLIRMPDGDLICFSDYEVDDAVAFRVNADLTPGGNDKFHMYLGEYPVFENYFSGFVEPTTGLNYLSWNMTDSEFGAGDAFSGWSPLTIWDGHGNRVGRVGFVDNYEGFYDTFDLAPGTGNVNAALTLLGRWAYYFAGYQNICRINIDSEEWQYATFPGSGTRHFFGTAFLDAGVLLTNTAAGTGPHGRLELYDYADLAWHDVYTEFGDFSTGPDYDFTGVSATQTIPVTDGAMQHLEGFSSNIGRLGNFLYWTYYNFGGPLVEFWELDVLAGTASIIASTPERYMDADGNFVDPDDGYEEDFFGAESLILVPAAPLHITGQLDRTRVRPYVG